MRLALIISLLLLCHLISAQVKLSSSVADYQILDNNSSRYVDLQIKNHGPKKAFIFRLETPENYTVRFSNKTLEQDSVRYIRIKYNPEKTGYFEDELQLHLSSNADPVTIKTKGFVKEFIPDSSPNCPSFENKNVVQETRFELTVEVRDKLTGNGIPKTKVQMIYNGVPAFTLETGSSGKISREVPLGLYYFVFTAEGYNREEFTAYVNRNNNYVLAELEQQQPELLDTTIFEDEITLDPDPVDPDLPDLVLEDSVLLVDTSEFSVNKYAANNIVFCVDISSSMKYTGKLDLLKASMIELTHMLRPIDNITIVTYASEADVLMTTTSASDKKTIIKQIESLEAQGHTAGIEGMKLAYSKACNAYIHGGNNQIIMATDGGFNRGKGSTKRLAKKYAKKNVKMSVVGIKNTYRHEQSMREVASSGGGHFVPIKNYDDAKIALKQEIMSQSILLP